MYGKQRRDIHHLMLMTILVVGSLAFAIYSVTPIYAATAENAIVDNNSDDSQIDVGIFDKRDTMAFNSDSSNLKNDSYGIFQIPFQRFNDSSKEIILEPTCWEPNDASCPMTLPSVPDFIKQILGMFSELLKYDNV